MKTPATLIAALLGLGTLGGAHASMPNASNHPVHAGVLARATGETPPGQFIRPTSPPGLTHALPAAGSNSNQGNASTKFSDPDFDIPGTDPATSDIHLLVNEQTDKSDRSAGHGPVPELNFIAGGNPGLDEASSTQGTQSYAASYLSDTSSLISSSVKGYGHTPVIPEPETYALMLAGLGLICFARRRNLKKK